MDPWLQQLRHDLVKRALWPARDLRATLAEGGSATPADLAALRAGLFDLRAPDGAPCDALTLLGHLKELAPEELLLRLGQRLAAFEAAVAAAQEAAAQDSAAQQAEAQQSAADKATSQDGDLVQPLLAALFEVEVRFEALHCSAIASGGDRATSVAPANAGAKKTDAPPGLHPQRKT
jgi:hypothetical protein